MRVRSARERLECLVGRWAAIVYLVAFWWAVIHWLTA